MTPWKTPPPSPSPLLPAAHPRSPSTWGPVALRIGAVVIALLVLAWIGRTAAAGSTLPPVSVVTEQDEAGSGLDAAAIAPPPVLPMAPTIASASAHVHASPTEPVFLNHASVDELRRLPGVGPKRAEAILVLRQRLGRFQRVEDLLRVKGVGRRAVKKWRPLVRLDTPPAPEDAADGGSR